MAEGSAQLIVCAEMTATPSTAVLAKDVVVNLTTQNGTGIIILILSYLNLIQCTKMTSCACGNVRKCDISGHWVV